MSRRRNCEYSGMVRNRNCDDSDNYYIHRISPSKEWRHKMVNILHDIHKISREEKVCVFTKKVYMVKWTLPVRLRKCISWVDEAAVLQRWYLKQLAGWREMNC